jgi:hypothetical protein
MLYEIKSSECNRQISIWSLRITSSDYFFITALHDEGERTKVTNEAKSKIIDPRGKSKEIKETEQGEDEGNRTKVTTESVCDLKIKTKQA